MQINHRRLPRVDVLAISGRLEAVETPNLQNQINQLFNAGRYRILLDLGELEYINSAALRILVSARKRAQEHRIAGSEHGDVRIVNLPPRVKQVFDLVGFTTLFDIYDDMVEAVASF